MLSDDFDYEVGLAILMPDSTWFLEEILIDSDLDSNYAPEDMHPDHLLNHLEETAWHYFLDKFDPPDEITGFTMLWYEPYEGDD